MNDKTYNGWSNRETWAINLWFNPESKNDVRSARDHVEETIERLPDWLRELIPDNSINWYELEEAMDDDDEETDADL